MNGTGRWMPSSPPITPPENPWWACRRRSWLARSTAREVPLEHVSRYGIVNATNSQGSSWDVTTIVEKPAPKEAPSRWAVVGRYVLEPRVFEHLAALEPGVGGEYQLTDALAALAREGRLVAAPIPAKRYDTGNKLDYLKANIEFALKRDELRPEFIAYLKDLAQEL